MKAYSHHQPSTLRVSVLSEILALFSHCRAAFIRFAKVLKTSTPLLPMQATDISSPHYQAAKKIVDCINHSYTHAQLATTARMVALFERKYDASLPLRRWWQAKSLELTYYPPNA